MNNRIPALLAVIAVSTGLMIAGQGIAQAATDKGESCHRSWIDSDDAVLCRSWNDHGSGDGYYDGEYWVKPKSNHGYVYPMVKVDGVNGYFTVADRHSYKHKPPFS